jgi:hypothetical protein
VGSSVFYRYNHARELLVLPVRRQPTLFEKVKYEWKISGYCCSGTNGKRPCQFFPRYYSRYVDEMGDQDAMLHYLSDSLEKLDAMKDGIEDVLSNDVSRLTNPF